MRMNDKVALVTGSTRGIGRGIATMFAKEGAKVVIIGRTRDLGQQAEAEIRKAGGDALYVPTDIGKDEDVQAMVRAAVQRYGKVTTLVNNAAPTEMLGPGKEDDAVTELKLESWDRLMNVLLTGMIRCCKAAIPEMAKAGGGSIVNISSAAGVLGLAGQDTYTAAKGAIQSLTRSMAVEYAPKNIRSNCIIVGFVPTGARAHKMLADPVFGPATRAIHLTRLGTPEDIAYAATYLASDEAGFVTGALLPVDGGVTCKINVPRITQGPGAH
jgi:3-oxoacyl-[acyl-carrier protein] reductase